MRIRDAVLQIAGRLVQYTKLSRSTAKGFDSVELPEEGPGEPKNQHPARRMQWFGFRSRPPTGSESAVILSRGASSAKMIVGADHWDYGPADLADGETAVFNIVYKGQNVCVIRLDKDGHIVEIPKSGAKVKLGDGTDANLDPVALYTQLKADFDAFVGKFNAHKHATAGMGAPSVPDVTATVLSTSVASSNVVAKK